MSAKEIKFQLMPEEKKADLQELHLRLGQNQRNQGGGKLPRGSALVGVGGDTVRLRSGYWGLFRKTMMVYLVHSDTSTQNSLGKLNSIFGMNPPKLFVLNGGSKIPPRLLKPKGHYNAIVCDTPKIQRCLSKLLGIPQHKIHVPKGAIFALCARSVATMDVSYSVPVWNSHLYDEPEIEAIHGSD